MKEYCKKCKKLISIGLNELFSKEYEEGKLIVSDTSSESIHKGLCKKCYEMGE
jgi:hypothetical protein